MNYSVKIDLLQQRIADLESENLVSRQKHQIFSSELAHYKSVSKSLDKINGELGECAVSYHNSLHTHQESLQNVRVVMEGFHSGFEKKIANVKADIFRRLRETENHLLAASDRIHILETILKTNNSAQESRYALIFVLLSIVRLI